MKSIDLCTTLTETSGRWRLSDNIRLRNVRQQHIYQSPQDPGFACWAILWKERSKAPEAAQTLRLTGKDLLELGIVDDIIKEPLGGAHREPQEMAGNIKAVIKRDLDILNGIDKNKLIKQRYDKFRKIGVFVENKPE